MFSFFFFCYYYTHFISECVQAGERWPLFPLTPQWTLDMHYLWLHFRWSEVCLGPSAQEAGRLSLFQVPLEHLMEEVGNSACLAAILACTTGQVPKIHFNLCWVNSTVSQELNQGRKSGLWMAISVPCPPYLLKVAHSYQHKSCPRVLSYYCFCLFL